MFHRCGQLTPSWHAVALLKVTEVAEPWVLNDNGPCLQRVFSHGVLALMPDLKRSLITLHRLIHINVCELKNKNTLFYYALYFYKQYHLVSLNDQHWPLQYVHHLISATKKAFAKLQPSSYSWTHMLGCLCLCLSSVCRWPHGFWRGRRGGGDLWKMFEFQELLPKQWKAPVKIPRA